VPSIRFKRDELGVRVFCVFEMMWRRKEERIGNGRVWKKVLGGWNVPRKNCGVGFYSQHVLSA